MELSLTPRTVPAAAVPAGRSDVNRMQPGDRAVHDWYRFVLSFPPHLVRDTLDRFDIGPGQRVLDPFCGTGTTVVECKKQGIESVGIEANPMAHFAGCVKLDWSPDPEALLRHARTVAAAANQKLAEDGLEDIPTLRPADEKSPPGLRKLPAAQEKLLLTGSISLLPLHKALVLLEALDQRRDPAFDAHERLAFARCIVARASNLHFGPEVGVGRARLDAPVASAWLEAVSGMAADLERLGPAAKQVPGRVHRADARDLSMVEDHSIDAVITSPPYPNEKDYTRTTRLESVLLGFIRSKQDLQALKKTLVRSNTRGAYKEDQDDRWVKDHPEIQRIAVAIEARRLELGKTSGFERMYARVTRLYFGGMARHLSELRRVLQPGARLAYVVGDQASYLRVMIRTGEILADLAHSLGYEVTGIDLFRTRLATGTQDQLREEVLLLRWPGQRSIRAV